MSYADGFYLTLAFNLEANKLISFFWSPHYHRFGPFFSKGANEACIKRKLHKLL